MSDSRWGQCKECEWFQVEPGVAAVNSTMGLCIEEHLQPVRLRVSGNSGCNDFSPGEVAHAEGSSAAPPAATPTK